jgi:hypothetical protein
MTQEVLISLWSDYGMATIFLLNLAGFAILQGIAEDTRTKMNAIQNEPRELRIQVETKFV